MKLEAVAGFPTAPHPAWGNGTAARVSLPIMRMMGDGRPIRRAK